MRIRTQNPHISLYFFSTSEIGIIVQCGIRQIYHALVLSSTSVSYTSILVLSVRPLLDIVSVYTQYGFVYPLLSKPLPPFHDVYQQPCGGWYSRVELSCRCVTDGYYGLR